MTPKHNFMAEIKRLLEPGDYQVSDLHPTHPIPGQRDNRLTFANTGVRFEAVTLYVDMRGSTKILQAHKEHNVAKVHKAFLYVGTTLIAEHGGHVRSYNGDSILAFFRGSSKASVASAICAAMQMVYLCTHQDAAQADFARYSAVDFGIGIDVGHILCVKAGKGGNENQNDLIWLGNAVNRAARLSDKGGQSQRIWISDAVRHLQDDNVRHGGTGEARKDMWTKDTLAYAGADEVAWQTGYYWQVR